MTQKQLKYARILFVLYLAAVLFLCFGKFGGKHDVPPELWGIPMDKIAHFLMFFPFPVLAYFAFDRFTKDRRTSVLFTVGTFAAGALFAAGTEWVQGFLSWRNGDITDFRADLLAIGVSSLAVLFLVFRKPKP